MTILFFHNFPDMTLLPYTSFLRRGDSVVQCGTEIFQMHSLFKYAILYTLYIYLFYIRIKFIFILFYVELLWQKFKKQNVIQVRKDNQEQNSVLTCTLLIFHLLHNT
jgi:hypothetical protein